MIEGFELDFIPVGESKKSGDAIAFRFGNLNGSRDEQQIVVIDAGYRESGEKLVDHVRTMYRTDTVDLVISTHPDQDHIGGLQVVLNELVVKELWMHCPWRHDSEVASFVARRTNAITKEKLQKSLDAACALEGLARRKGIPVTEPFKGQKYADGRIVVLSPSKKFYQQLLVEFRGQEERSQISESFLDKMIEEGIGLVQRIAEQWDIETLSDDGITSAENESSVVMLIRIAGKRILLTSDAGQRALTGVLDIFDEVGFNTGKLDFVQVPHHGSKRNVGPKLLDRLLGSRLSKPREVRCALASVCSGVNEKHPSKKVLNAFRRRGAPVHVTSGDIKCYKHNAPDRGWASSAPLPFFDEVDD